MPTASSPPTLLHRSLAVAETLLYGVAGGLLFAHFDVPAGLVTGAMIAVSLAALAQRPVALPKLLQGAAFVALGIALGSSATPAQVRSIIDFPLSIAFVLATIFVIALLTTYYLRRVHRWDALSAILGAIPGSFSQIMIIAADMNADLRGIVIVQVFRVVMLSAALMPALVVLGIVPPIHAGSGLASAAPGSLLLMVAMSATAAILMYRLRFPGGLLFGAMIASALLHALGLVEGGLPHQVRDTAMIVVGTMVGLHLAGIPIRMLLGYLGAAAGSLAIATVVAALSVAVAIRFLGTPPGGTLLAYVPGAIDTMMVISLAMNLDAVFVGAHHLARVIAITLSMPIVIRLGFGRASHKARPARPPDPID